MNAHPSPLRRARQTREPTQAARPPGTTFDAASTAAPDAMPCAEDRVSWALPMTESFMRLTRPFAAVTRRSMTRVGFTFSLRASTS